MPDPLIYIIIVNWNGLKDTLECLESVYAIDYPNFKVVVVDNGSQSDPSAEIRAKFPGTVLIRNADNLGFAEGNNVGIRYALKKGPDYIFLLNNDTIVNSRVLRELLEASRRFDNEGIFGAQIYYHAEPEKIWYAGAKWDPVTSMFHHLNTELHEGAIEETDYACGCALFFSAGIAERIGLLDRKFFLTYEETDWCYRALRAGIRSYCVANAKIYHKISVSFGGGASPLYTYFLTRNSLLWGERHLSRKEYIKLITLTARRIVWMSNTRSNFKHGSMRFLDIIIQHHRGMYDSLVSHAYYLGFRDYILRKFGNCSSNVSALLKPELKRNERIHAI